jgi:hypothetical protein
LTSIVDIDFKVEEIRTKIVDMQLEVHDIRFEVHGMRSEVHEIHTAIISSSNPSLSFWKNSSIYLSDLPTAHSSQSTNNCPPPSRIFLGRQIILGKMHQYFDRDLGKQHIYVLYGLGGEGKTQIGLKFIEESSQ